MRTSRDIRAEGESHSSTDAALLNRLERHLLIERRKNTFRTTPRWQGAMARAALRMRAAGDSGEDLRVPVASALVELCGTSIDDDVLVDLVRIMTSLELRELGAPAGPRHTEAAEAARQKPG